MVIHSFYEVFQVVRSDGKGRALNLQGRCTMKVLREEFGVRSSTHEDHTQVIGLLVQCGLEKNEQKVNLLTALVALIDNHMRNTLKHWIRVELSQKHSGSAKKDPGLCGSFGLETNRIADGFTNFLGPLLSNTCAQRYGRDTPWLRYDDVTLGSTIVFDGIFEDHLWDLSTFTTACLRTHHNHLVFVDHLDQSIIALVDRKSFANFDHLLIFGRGFPLLKFFK
mmetsp:Transcript_4403/g.13447  ORF Transcript_4403/g.13447 Transcript_4403/m.13447 type:complete len:223 (-) Transcript_4403:1952-2620(-)